MAGRSFPNRVTADAEVGLRLAEYTDAESITDWIRSPEVHRHWSGQPISLDEVLAKYTGRRAPEVVSYVISERRDPVGYIQAWQRAGRFGLDMFISAEAQGRNIGPRAAHALATDLASRGWCPLTVDPSLDNQRAVGAWRAAGFVATGEVGIDDGHATQIMEFDAAAAAPGTSG